MLTLLLRLARKFDKRTVAIFCCGTLVGAVVMTALFANHARQICNPLGVPGLILCRVS